ncbi:hypothetical protein [Streptomyces sp. NPDC051364]|uniref:hypothetical protein n=1 Tax=Streptomyces sp. NPDC051364 TaxID=3155799 RepID=UPI0034373354
MRVNLEGEEFKGVRLLGSNRVYEEVRAVRSTFSGCYLAQLDDPEYGLVVKNSSIEQCRLDRCSIQGVVFDTVTIDGLATKQLHRLHGCVFNRVTLRGKIGPIMAMGPHTSLPGRDNFIASIVDKYQEIEWALDISEATFSDADFYYVPGHLVRRDPETQPLLERERFSNVSASDLPTYAKIWVSRFNESPFSSLVGIAPKASKYFNDYMREIEWLRANNLVD